MKTSDFIDLLAVDSGARWRFGSIFGLATVLGILIAGGTFFVGIGFRPDISQAVGSVRFLFKFVVTATLAIGATGTALHLARPGVPVEQWRWVLAAVPVLLVGAVAVELIAVPRDAWMKQLVGHNARFCLTIIPLLAIAPLACLLIALREGATTRPGLSGALAGLAASGIAATFYAANCTDDSPLFVTTWYPIATLIVVTVGYLAGRKILRW
jgi:hypothetical protein